MNDNKAKHKHESNSLLYLPVDKGGKGMQELETLYKTTKIKTAHYLTVSADPHVQLVSTFQNVKTRSHYGRSSKMQEHLQVSWT